MATAITLAQYLTNQGAEYDVRAHAPTVSSMRTAEACHVSAECLAKAVVLKDETGYLMAVLPASHNLRLEDIEMQLNRSVRLAFEEEIERLFPDCVRGAVPPVGAAYGLATIVDDAIIDNFDVYFEGGDHATLVHMSGADFDRLMADAHHGRFSAHV